MSHVIYEIKFNRRESVLPNPSYIGRTRNTLKMTPNIEDIEDNVKIV